VAAPVEILGEDPLRATRDEGYFFYHNGSRVDHRATLTITADVHPAEGAHPLTADFSWRIDLDGKTVANDSRTVTRSGEEDEWLKEEFKVYADKDHQYSVRLRMWKDTAYVEILAAFLTAEDG